MKGVIYKIELNKNNIYVGSTTAKLSKRQGDHNYSLKKHPHRKLYKSCIENDINFIKCIWVADVEYDSIAELRKIEEDYRKQLNGNLNMVRCYTTEEEKKKQLKEYFEENKEYKKEYDKEYREENKDKIKEYGKKYYENNKIEISEKRKEKITCDKCNCLIRKSNISSHKKSMKCLLKSECLFTDEE